MSTYTTPTWGYKLVSDTRINFYHVLLPKISLNTLQTVLPHATTIQSQRDGSITISVCSPEYSYKVVRKIISYFEKRSQDFLDTPNYYYKIEKRIRQILRPWALSFEGCLALLLQHNPDLTKELGNDWQFINSPAGGLYFEPYTLFLYEEYAKVIHPITVQNYEIRKTIEHQTALFIKKMAKRIKEAQPGMQGIAMLSLVESQTGLSAKEITKIINDKSFGIKSPSRCAIIQ